MAYNASPSDFNTVLQQFSLKHQESSTPTSPSDTSSTRRRRRDNCSSRSRVSKACERCRVRKVKCDGGKPCGRCIEVDDICDYTRKTRNRDTKEYSQSYVDQLHEQNSRYKTAMRVLYANRGLSIHPDDMKLPSTEGKDVPLVHDILESLGLLQEGDAEEESEYADVPEPMPAPSRANTLSSSVESPGWVSPFDFSANITPTGPYITSAEAYTEFDAYNVDFGYGSGYFDPSSMHNPSMDVEEPAFDFEMGRNISFEDLQAVGNLMSQNQFVQGVSIQQNGMSPSVFEIWS